MFGRFALTGLICVVTTVCAEAQTDPLSGSPLTLAEAERRGLELNPQIAEARLGTEAADFLIAQRQGAFDSVFSTSLSHRGQTNPATTQLTGGINTVENQTSSYTSSVTRPLEWTGGRFEFDFNNDRTSTSNLFSNFNPSYTSSLVASYVQPLLRGLRLDQPREQLQQARLTRAATETALRQQVGQISAGVRRAYWDLVYTVDALQTARQSRDLALRQLEENRLRLELGTVAQIDVVQSEAEVATRTQATVVAEGAWHSAQVGLKRLIVANTSDSWWGTTIVPTDRPGYDVAPALDVSAAIARALGNRTDIEAVRQQAESLELNIRLLEDQQKPAMDVTSSLALAGVGGTRILRAGEGLGSSGVGTVPGGYFDALQALGSFDFPTWNVGLTFSVPFRNTQATAAIARGRVQRRQLDASLRTIELQVAATVTQIADQVTNANQQVQAAAVARRLAEQRLDLEASRLQAGLSTTFLVLQAQRDLATAQTTELRALLDYRKALVDFEQVQEAP